MPFPQNPMLRALQGTNQGVIDPDNVPSMDEAVGRFVNPDDVQRNSPQLKEGTEMDPQAMLAQLLQGGGDGSMPQPAPQPAGDPLMALKALLGQGAATGMMPQGQFSKGGQNPMAAALALMGGNAGQVGTGRGPATDSELMDMSMANQGVRGNLPIQPMGMDMTGFSDDVQPQKDQRQTPAPDGSYPDPNEFDGYQGETFPRDTSQNAYRPNIGAPGAPGQAIMGAYLNRNKSGPTAEDELDMVQKSLGKDLDKEAASQDDIDDDDIYALENDAMSEQAFDAKYGMGAAKRELQISADYDKENADKDKDPTTRNLSIDKQRAKGQANSDDDDDDY